MRHQVQEWRGVEQGWQPAYKGRMLPKAAAEDFLSLCRKVNGDRFLYRVVALEPELPHFV